MTTAAPGPKRRHVPRGTITREAIVETAFRLVADKGVGALSMPGLARRMGVGVTSLYWYVSNKDELLDAVAERGAAFLVRDEQPPSSDRWDTQLTEHFRHLRGVLEAHPGLGELVLSRGLPASAALGSDTHARVQSMIQAGLPPDAAVDGYVTIALYTLGYSAWAAAAAAAATSPAAGAARRRGVLASSRRVASPTAPSDRGFEVGLGLVIAGLRQRFTPPNAQGGRS